MKKPDPFSDLIEVKCTRLPGLSCYVEFYKGSATNDPGRLRDLAAWLLAAAAWLEQAEEIQP